MRDVERTRGASEAATPKRTLLQSNNVLQKLEDLNGCRWHGPHHRPLARSIAFAVVARACRRRGGHEEARDVACAPFRAQQR